MSNTLRFPKLTIFDSIVIQYEDFKNPFPALERYQNVYSTFNDDIQVSNILSALRTFHRKDY